jgi:hypothetical protein
MRLVGLAICLGTIIVAAATVGFLIMKGNPENHMKNFGDGAVYFGWLGTLVGLIAITGNKFMVWGDVEKNGSSFSSSNANYFVWLYNKVGNYCPYRRLILVRNNDAIRRCVGWVVDIWLNAYCKTHSYEQSCLEDYGG